MTGKESCVSRQDRLKDNNGTRHDSEGRKSIRDKADRVEWTRDGTEEREREEGRKEKRGEPLNVISRGRFVKKV